MVAESIGIDNYVVVRAKKLSGRHVRVITAKPLPLKGRVKRLKNIIKAVGLCIRHAVALED